jgi:hypothetical protein
MGALGLAQGFLVADPLFVCVLTTSTRLRARQNIAVPNHLPPW